MKKISILIADDHEVARSGLAAIFGFQKDFAVVGEAKNGEEAIRLAKRHRPDVVVMDLVMPVKDGVEATREIVADVPSAKILILTTFATSADLQRALDAGAAGAVSKDAPNRELVAAIRAVSHGERAVSSDIENQLAAADMPVLTDRQREILEALTRGLSNLDIAKMCGISEDGVKAHMKTLFAKLNVSNRLEAASYALKHKLVR